MRLVFRNASVIDVEQRRCARQTVVVAGATIASVADRVHDHGPDVVVIDCEGLTMLPGLIDCHVHLSLDAGQNPVETVERESDDDLFMRTLANVQTTIRKGVTTVRDLGGRGGVAVRVRDALSEWGVRASRVVAAGPAITTPGGHGHFVGVEVTQEPAALRDAVRDVVGQGADWVKVMATGGLLTPASNADVLQYDTTCLTALVDQARQHARKVAAHVLSAIGAQAAIAAGVSSIEHGLGLDDDLMGRMRQEGIYLVPVLSPSDRQTRLENRGLVADYVRERIEVVKPELFRMCQRAIALGVPIAAGTDAGVPLVPHGGVLSEVGLLIELGMNPYDALRAATICAAQLLGLDREIGSISPGKGADLLLLRENPLTERVCTSPAMVVRDGIPMHSALEVS